MRLPIAKKFAAGSDSSPRTKSGSSATNQMYKSAELKSNNAWSVAVNWWRPWWPFELVDSVLPDPVIPEVFVVIADVVPAELLPVGRTLLMAGVVFVDELPVSCTASARMAKSGFATTTTAGAVGAVSVFNVLLL